MIECKKLQVIAEELSCLAGEIKEKQTEKTIQEIMLTQCLYGIQLSIGTTLSQIKQAVSIEEVNGDS